jgi:hypothetical protein
LAGTINQQRRADLQQLQGRLEGRGLAAYDPQQDLNRTLARQMVADL